MLKKGSKLFPIVHIKCPKCHEGDLFPTGSFEFSNPFDMNTRCPVCQENFMPEPGFYYGSMFISYIFTGWFCLSFVGVTHWIFGWSTAASFGLLILILAVLFVWIFRMARSIWIGLNVKYRGY
ncbi:MAG: hypothetical protein ACI8P3_004374 [Saprospiraceae bacterium]|jgi:uncharacterized protein (DUF983 family)